LAVDTNESRTALKKIWFGFLEEMIARRWLVVAALEIWS
jgi:hypothetical protein